MEYGRITVGATVGTVGPGLRRFVHSTAVQKHVETLLNPTLRSLGLRGFAMNKDAKTPTMCFERSVTVHNGGVLEPRRALGVMTHPRSSVITPHAFAPIYAYAGGFQPGPATPRARGQPPTSRHPFRAHITPTHDGASKTTFTALHNRDPRPFARWDRDAGTGYKKYPLIGDARSDGCARTERTMRMAICYRL